MYECFYLWAYYMSISAFWAHVYILGLFSTNSLYLSMMSRCTLRDPKFQLSWRGHPLRREQSSNQGQFLPINNLGLSCFSFKYEYIKSDCIHLQMAQSNEFNCTYPGTKLLNSYPCNFYETIHWIEIIEPLSMGACVIARLHAWLTRSAEMQAERRPWLLLPRKQVPLIVYNHQFVGMTTTEWLQPPFGGTSKPQWRAATDSLFHSQSTTLSFPDPLCTCLWDWHVPQDYSQCFYFTHTEESPLHAFRRATAWPPTEESLHSTAKKIWCSIWC